MFSCFIVFSISDNFSSVALCKDIHYNEFSPLSKTKAEQFLPEVQHSCSISHKSYKRHEKPEWKKFKLFESEIFKGQRKSICTMNNQNVFLYSTFFSLKLQGLLQCGVVDKFGL